MAKPFFNSEGVHKLIDLNDWTGSRFAWDNTFPKGYYEFTLHFYVQVDSVIASFHVDGETSATKSFIEKSAPFEGSETIRFYSDGVTVMRFELAGGTINAASTDAARVSVIKIQV